jgi:site-specific recombinase XerD
MYRLAEDAIREATTDIELAREFIAWRAERQIAYKDFLKNPPPDWVSTTKWRRNDPRHRPCTGPLSDASPRQAMIAVKGLMGFPEQTGYLRRNPGALVRNVRAPSGSRITRCLTQGAIALALETVSSRQADTPTAFRRPPEPDMLDAFQSYGQAFELLPQASRIDRTPLVLTSRSREPARITDEAAAEAIKAVFADGARAADAKGDQDTAATPRLASAHWLRHSMLTNHANNGVQLKTLQDTAGHANIATTAAYLHKTDNERRDEIVRSANGKGIV